VTRHPSRVALLRAFPGAARARHGAEDDVAAGRHEHYDDVFLYDYEYRRRRADLRFYRQLAGRIADRRAAEPNAADRAPLPILELACGTGRVTRALVRDGHAVVGVDLSAPMLVRATARLGRLGRGARARFALVRADMRRFALGARFPLVVMAFNSFEHLYTLADVVACLARVREHLTADGVFAFDVQNPDLRWLVRDPDKRWARTRFKHPVTGAPTIYTTNHVYDPVRQIAIIRLYYEDAATGDTQVVTLSQRKFFPAELVALLETAGFEVTARYGDFEGEPLSGGADSQVIVCRPRA
jgi:SAM-dependent methyltransferase